MSKTDVTNEQPPPEADLENIEPKFYKAGDQIAENAIKEGLVLNTDTGNAPEITFGSILNQISFILKDFPEIEKPLRHRKLMYVLEKKFNGLLDTSQGSNLLDDEKKTTIKNVTDKLAQWIEGVIAESEIRLVKEQAKEEKAKRPDEETNYPTLDEDEEPADLGPKISDVYEVIPDDSSTLKIENITHPPPSPSVDSSTMTELSEEVRVWEFLQGPGDGSSRMSIDLRNWVNWITGVTLMAEDWGSWINKTVKSAEKKAMKKRGEVVTPTGDIAKLTKSEWQSWKRKVSKEAMTFTRANSTIQKTAGEWSQFFSTVVKSNQLG